MNSSVACTERSVLPRQKPPASVRTISIAAKAITHMVHVLGASGTKLPHASARGTLALARGLQLLLRRWESHSCDAWCETTHIQDLYFHVGGFLQQKQTENLCLGQVLDESAVGGAVLTHRANAARRRHADGTERTIVRVARFQPARIRTQQVSRCYGPSLCSRRGPASREPAWE